MGLRDVTPEGVSIGACAEPEDLDDPRCRRLLAEEFDLLTVENHLKWGPVHPERDRYDFSGADRLIGFAEEHDMAVTGHSLVWHMQNPAWLEEGDFEAEELRTILADHIRTVVGRYDGRIAAWDVVNEAVDDDGELRRSVWYEGLGEDYIAQAFREARKHTDAELFYNEYGLPYDDVKRERVHRLLEDLLDQGVPIDGIGIQMHCVGIQPSPGQVRRTIEQFQELGLKVRITELDLAYEKDEAPADLGTAQAEYYRAIVATCLDAGVDSIAWWGVLDDNSWITVFQDYPDRYTQQPLLFDADGEPKQAYHAVEEVLKERNDRSR